MSAVNTPGVTVLMPVHGDAPYLSAAVESSVAQELDADWELLIILDRPSVTTQQRVAGYVSGRVRAVSSRGEGLVAALNTGLDEARYEFVARMDSDDVMLPMRLASQWQVLQSHSDVSVVGGQLLVIDDSGAVMGRRRYPVTPRWMRFQLRFRNCLAHPAVMYRKSEVLSIGGYGDDWLGAEDYDLWCRLVRNGELRNLGTDVLKYRVHAGQMTQERKRLVADATFAVQRSSWRSRAGGRIGRILDAGTLAIDACLWAARRMARRSHHH